MALKLIGQGMRGPCRTFITRHFFHFEANSLVSDAPRMRLARYHHSRCWETADGTLLTRLDCPGPVLVLLFDGGASTVAYPCRRRCHMADGKLYADDKPIAHLEPSRGWRIEETGRCFRALEVREQAALW